MRSTGSRFLFITYVGMLVVYHMIQHLGSGEGLIIAYDPSSAG